MKRSLYRKATPEETAEQKRSDARADAFEDRGRLPKPAKPAAKKKAKR